MANRQDPFFQTLEYAREEAAAAAKDLLLGRWETLEQAKAHVSRYKAMRDIVEKMRHAGGPGTDFGEENLMTEILKP